MTTSFFIAIGSVVGLGFVGFLFVWFGAPLAKKKPAAEALEQQMELSGFFTTQSATKTQTAPKGNFVGAGR